MLSLSSKRWGGGGGGYQEDVGREWPIPETTGMIRNWNENSVSYFAVSSVHDGRGGRGGSGGGMTRW